jgi:hypothetical protein
MLIKLIVAPHPRMTDLVAAGVTALCAGCPAAGMNCRKERGIQ